MGESIAYYPLLGDLRYLNTVNKTSVIDAINEVLGKSAVYPSQIGNSGKFLTTNGISTSWGTIPAGSSGTNGLNGTTNIGLGGALSGNVDENIGANSIDWHGNNGTWALDSLMDNTPGGSLISHQAKNSAGNRSSTLNISAQTSAEYIEMIVGKAGNSSGIRLNVEDGILLISDAISNIGIKGDSLFVASGPNQYAQYGNVVPTTLIANTTINCNNHFLAINEDDGINGTSFYIASTIISISAADDVSNNIASIETSANSDNVFSHLFYKRGVDELIKGITVGNAIPGIIVADTIDSIGLIGDTLFAVSGPNQYAQYGNFSSYITGRKINATSFIATIGGKLAQAVSSVGNTDTSEDDLHVYGIPANILTINGDTLRVEAGGLFVASATATRRLKLYFGGTAIFDSGALTTSLSSQWTIIATIIEVSSTVVRYMVQMVADGVTLASPVSVGELTGLDLTTSNVLKLTGQAASTGAAANDIVNQISSVYWYPQGD